MKVVPKRINKSELSTALDIGLEQLRKLCKEGMPCSKQKNRLMFSPKAVFEWCVVSGRHKHANKIAGKFPDVVTAMAKTDSEIPATANLDEYIDRVRFNECALHVFVKANADNKEGLVWAISNYDQACKRRLDVEEKISKIKLEQSRTIPAEVAEKKIIEMAQSIKTHFLGMAGKIAPLCEGKSTAEINDIMAKEIHATLRNYANDHT